MSFLFNRTSEININLAKKFETCGWVAGIFNLLSLIFYFWIKYEKANMIYRLCGSFIASAVILAVEFATLSVIFDPSVMDDFLAQTKSENDFSKAVGVTSVLILSCLAMATFYYDYTINLNQMKMGNSIDAQILAVVMVLISEMFFWASAVLTSAAKSSSGGGGGRR